MQPSVRVRETEWKRGRFLHSACCQYVCRGWMHWMWCVRPLTALQSQAYVQRVCLITHHNMRRSTEILKGLIVFVLYVHTGLMITSVCPQCVMWWLSLRVWYGLERERSNWQSLCAVMFQLTVWHRSVFGIIWICFQAWSSFFTLRLSEHQLILSACVICSLMDLQLNLANLESYLNYFQTRSSLRIFKNDAGAITKSKHVKMQKTRVLNLEEDLEMYNWP